MEKDTPPGNDAPVTETVTNPENTPHPENTPPPVNPKDDIIDDLGKRLSDVEAQLAGILQTADTTPVKRPWTHRRFFGEN